MTFVRYVPPSARARARTFAHRQAARHHALLAATSLGLQNPRRFVLQPRVGDVVELSCSTAEEAALWVTAVRQLMAELEEVTVQARVTRELMQHDAAAAVKATMANVSAAASGTAAGVHLRNRNMASISPVPSVTPDTLKLTSAPPPPSPVRPTKDSMPHAFGSAVDDAPRGMRNTLPTTDAWSVSDARSITPVTVTPSTPHADVSAQSSPARLPPLGAVVHTADAAAPAAAVVNTRSSPPRSAPLPPSPVVSIGAPAASSSTSLGGSSDAIGLIDDASTRCLPLPRTSPQPPAPPTMPCTTQPPPPPPVPFAPPSGSATPSRSSLRLPAASPPDKHSASPDVETAASASGAFTLTPAGRQSLSSRSVNVPSASPLLSALYPASLLTGGELGSARGLSLSMSSTDSGMHEAGNLSSRRSSVTVPQAAPGMLRSRSTSGTDLGGLLASPSGGTSLQRPASVRAVMLDVTALGVASSPLHIKPIPEGGVVMPGAVRPRSSGALSVPPNLAPPTTSASPTSRARAATRVQAVYRGHILRRKLHEWVRVPDDDGDAYWYNEGTGEALWTHPFATAD